MAINKKRYKDLNSYLRSIFKCRVQKITVDAGLSCPNRDGTTSTGGCIYCNVKGSGTDEHRIGISIAGQLRKDMAYVARRYNAKKFIAYFQAFSNTYAPVDQLEQLYDEALSVENIVGLFVGTRPDCIDGPVLDLLKNYTENYLVWLELGLQSAHDRTLSLIRRGHSLRSFEKAVSMAKQKGIKVCCHIILGLPGESREDMLETARVVAAMGVDGIKLHQLYVLRETEMEGLYNSGNYKCLEQEEYAELVCDFLELLPKETIIHRLTGDPHAEELVAPEWSLDKRGTLELINQRLEERDTWQGRLCKE